MKLIDADRLSDTFETEMCEGCSSECVDGYGKCNCPIHYMKELLWQQPTAYDVDKVVEELENKGNYFIDPWVSYMFKKQSKDIVKRGGVDD